VMSSSLVVGGIKVSGDRDPKISSARTTLHAAWAICSRAVSVACANSVSEGQSCDPVKCSVAAMAMTHEYEKKI